MSRYTPDDIARLGPDARQQIANVRFGIDEQQRQRDVLDKPRSKYGNRKTEVDGVVFDSKAEADRWLELKLLHRAGRISCLIRQPEFPITVNGCTVARYIADFEYRDLDGKRIVEDLKGGAKGGTRTAVYRLKRKLVAAIHGIEITEVMS